MAEKKTHENFVSYMKFIAEHENYKDMPGKYKEDGSIRWVVTGKSALGRKRDQWWKEKIDGKTLKIKADVARAIHPPELNGYKVCQICGEKKSIFYVYPNANTAKKIESILGIEITELEHELKDIISLSVEIHGHDDAIVLLETVFGIEIPNELSKEGIAAFLEKNAKNKLSPGVMANPPDRFDGFHSYNKCCRSVEDTGRHAENMKTYVQDRRTYEFWSEGDFNAANRLMGEFSKDSALKKCPICGEIKKMSADHIGPISLGFSHRPKFQPMCSSCNSSKNNRMTLADVRALIADEEIGSRVVSWHSEYIWNKLKYGVSCDEDAKKLSDLMAKNMQNVLWLLAEISSLEFGEGYLKNYLKPEYSFYDVRFNNFDMFNLNDLEIVRLPLDSANKKKHAERYIRKSFDSLKTFRKKGNRNVNFVIRPIYQKSKHHLERLLRSSKNSQAHTLIVSMIEELGEQLILGW